MDFEVVLRKRKGGKVPPPPQRLSSLGRESTGTVVAREDLQREKEKEKEAEADREVREGSAVSGDLSFDSEERRERISAKTLMAAQHIPSLCCTITPPPSGQNTPINSSPVPAR